MCPARQPAGRALVEQMHFLWTVANWREMSQKTSFPHRQQKRKSFRELRGSCAKKFNAAYMKMSLSSWSCNPVPLVELLPEEEACRGAHAAVAATATVRVQGGRKSARVITADGAFFPASRRVQPPLSLEISSIAFTCQRCR